MILELGGNNAVIVIPERPEAARTRKSPFVAEPPQEASRARDPGAADRMHAVLGRCSPRGRPDPQPASSSSWSSTATGGSSGGGGAGLMKGRRSSLQSSCTTCEPLRIAPGTPEKGVVHWPAM